MYMQATFYKSHMDGFPMQANQHPLHYPHGTLFMAPGPIGQTGSVPKDPGLQQLMEAEFENYVSIHERYNFDYDPDPESIMGKALAWWEAKEQDQQKEEKLADQIADDRHRPCAPQPDLHA
jgi:hypothetical protein